MFHSTGGSAPSGWNIWSNGYISTHHDFDPVPTTITVRARGEFAGGAWPHMIVRVAETAIGNVNVTSSSFTDYSFAVDAIDGTQEVRVEFDNDFYDPPADRNLIVDKLILQCPP